MNSGKIRKNLMILTVLIIAGLIITSNSFAQEKISRVEAANNEMKKSLDLRDPHISHVSHFLENRNYKRLEGIYIGLHKKYKDDAAYESPLQNGYDLFDPENKIMEDDLDHWVKTTESAIAYAARGIFKAQKGCNTRGTKFSSKTKQWQFNLMMSYFEEGFKDLIIATEKDSTNMPAYKWMIVMAKLGGDIQTAEMILRRALEVDNRAFYVRSNFMGALYPRWGGNHYLMQLFADECANALDQNPRLWRLQGAVDYDKGRISYENKNYHKAIEHMTKSLSYGDNIFALKIRAYCYGKIGEEQKSIDDYNRILFYEPYDETARRVAVYQQFHPDKIGNN